MKTIKEIFTRVKELALKLIGVKAALAIAAFAAFVREPNEWTFWALALFGSLLVVGREYGKFLEVLKLVKGIPPKEL